MIMMSILYIIRGHKFPLHTHARTASAKTLVQKMASAPLSGGLTAKDLDAEELNVTSAVLMGAAHHYGKHCDGPNEAFMECRTDSKDPRKCLAEGRAVTRCALDFFRAVKGSCNDAFTAHWTCLDEHNQSFKACRKTQKAFDACMEKRSGSKEPPAV